MVRALHERDPDGASGVWQVTLHEETEPVGIAAGAALDTFHATVAIGELDDFEISAHDPFSLQEIYEADDYKRGGQAGDVARIANSLRELQHRIPAAAVLLVGYPVDGCRTIGPFNEVTPGGRDRTGKQLCRSPPQARGMVGQRPRASGYALTTRELLNSALRVSFPALLDE